MRKITKIWRKVLWVLASALILLVVVPPLAIRIPAVQTLVKNAAVNILSDQLGARVAIGAVRLRWYLDLSLQDVQLDDLRGAPLLRVGEARVDIGSLRLRKRILVVASLRLDRPGVMILRRAGEEDTNLQFLLDRFAAGDTAAAPAWTFRLDALEVTGGSFVYEDEARGRVDYGIDWDHLRVDSLYLSLKDYHLQGDTHVFRLDHLALREGSGFLLDTLTGDMSLSEQVLQARRLLVRTAGARLDLDLAFTYDSFGAFNHFIDSVYVRAALRPSRLDMAELAYFAPELRTMHNRLTLSGNLKGYVSAFRARELEIGMGQDLILAADLDVNGLPEVKETFVDARIRQLELQASSLERFRLPESSRFGEMPAILHRLGTTRIRGVFTGFYNDFVAQADVQAAQGSVNTDLVLRQEPGGMTYRGSISSPAFDLGGLLELRGMLGSLRLDMEVEGRGTDWSTLDLKMQGVVDSLELQGETFTRIDIHGMMEGKRYTGQLAVDDDLLGLDFNGEVDLEGEVPRFDVMASVHHARLDRLTRNAFGKYLSAKGEVMLNFSGDRLDQLEGTMGIEGLELADTAERLRCRSLLLSFEPDDRRYKAVRLRSDLADLDIEGSFRFEELYHGLGYSLQRLLPTAGWKAAIPAPEVGHYANLELTLYETAPLSAIFFPGLYFAFGTQLNARMLAEGQDLNWQMRSPELSFNGVDLRDAEISGSLLEAGAGLKLRGSSLAISDSIKTYVPTADFLVTTDSAEFVISWQDQQGATTGKGMLRGFASLPDTANLVVRLSESRIPLDSLLWTFNTDHAISIDPQGVSFRNVMLSHKLQMIRLNGKLDRSPESQLGLQFNHFDIRMAHLLLEPYGVELEGIMDGDVTLMSVLGTPRGFSSLNIRDFTFNGDLLGDAQVLADWQPDLKRLRTDTRVIYQGNAGQSVPLEVTGFYYPERDTGNFDLNISVSNLKLSILQPYISTLSSRLSGFLSGQLGLSGTTARPVLAGRLTARRAAILIDYLNEEYSFTHDIIVKPDGFVVQDLELSDAQGQKALCNGGIYHEGFRDLRVDFSVAPQAFSVLNTTLAQNELFYGRGKGTGTARFSGPPDDLLMDIRATTDKGTRIHIPISYDAEVSDRGYITFIDPRAKAEEEMAGPASLSGIRMNFDLTATPDAEVEISLPSRMGQIKGKGNGNLRFNIDTRGEFNMFGDYEISEGFFDMTLQNLLSRRFEIRKGSQIRWNGDPYAAELAMVAVYKVRASLRELMPVGDSSAYRQRVPVNCIIRLSDNLLSPGIRFAFELPESSEEVNRIVFSQIDTTNDAMMSRQMISLLVLNSFISEEGSGSLASGVSASSFELLSMQLSNWLSQISQDFDIGVHYRPGDEMTNEELELALTTQVLNDRVLINGNVGIAGERNTSNASSLVGDVQIEVKLTEDGRFRVKAFNKSNYVDLLDTRAPYTQGVGVFYRKEFDELEEVFRPRRTIK